MTIRLTIPDPRVAQALSAAGLSRYEDFLACDSGEVVARSGTSETRRIRIRAPGDELDVYLKSYRHGGRRPLLRDKAAIEARNYSLLRERCGLNVPEVLAFGSRRAGLRLLDAFILTRGIAGAAPLDEYAARRWPNPGAAAGEADRVELIVRAARVFAQMHAAGFFHIDPQWRNLLLAAGADGAPAIYLIDSSRGSLRRWSVLREHGRLRDLSSLQKEASRRMTQREQIRWLREYLGVRRLAEEHRAMIRTILYDRALKDHGA